MTSLEGFLLAITTLLAVIGYFAKDKIERMEAELISIRNDVYEFRDNYLDRFEKVNKAVNDSREEIMEKLHHLELTLKNKQV